MQTAPNSQTSPTTNSVLKNDILEAIGNTPLVKLNKVVQPGSATVYAKCEFMNPAG